MAFDEFTSFPTREQLHAKQLSYLEVLHERLNKRQQIRNQLNLMKFPSSSALLSNHVRDFPIEGITFNDDIPGVGYVLAGHHKKGKLAIIQMVGTKAFMTALNIEVFKSTVL
uniref:CACTA en-spm transposon protein n=1 Tax=Steinernema glaseri TaxID=37863 RepID=A0A1I7YS29_9BILA